MDSNDLKVTIYIPNSSNTAFFSVLLAIIKDIKPANELAIRLFLRDIKSQYRQSVLGFVWVLIPPLLTAGLWIFLNNHKIVNVGETVIPYPLFVMIGTILWQVFAEAVNQPRLCVNANKSMLTKINFPREALLISAFYTVMFNLGPKLIVIAAACYFYDIAITPSIIFFPLGVLMISLIGFTIGLLLTPPGLLINDVARGIGIILPFAMYLTPVIYPAPSTGTFALLMQYNPLATLLSSSRDWLTGNLDFIPYQFTLISGFTLLFLLIGVLAYRISMPIITERFGG